MSYSIGDTKEWSQWSVDPDDVYVWRSEVDGAAVDRPADASRILRAVAKASSGLGLDVRSILVDSSGGPTILDVIFTADSFSPLILPETADDVADGVSKDADLRSKYPSLVVGPSRFLQLTGPPDAVDFWKSHAIVWDDKVGPLKAFSDMEGIYEGTADDGPRARPWREDPPDLNGNDEKSDAPRLIGWAIAGIAVWLGTKVFGDSGEKS